MSAWIVIAVTDLNDYLVAAQVAAMRTAALAVGQSDPFTNVMHDRANYVRNRISRRIQISETAFAVPPELKGQTCLLIIEAMQGRLKLNLTEDQKTAISRAYRDLDIAATDDFPVSTPDDPVQPDVQAGGGMRVVSSRTRAASGSKLSGL